MVADGMKMIQLQKEDGRALIAVAAVVAVAAAVADIGRLVSLALRLARRENLD